MSASLLMKPQTLDRNQEIQNQAVQTRQGEHKQVRKEKFNAMLKEINQEISGQKTRMILLHRFAKERVKMIELTIMNLE